MDLLETFTYDTTTHKTFNGFVTTYNYSNSTYRTRAEMGEDTFRSAWFYYVAFTCATEVGYDVGDVSRFVKREKGYDGAFDPFLDGLLPVQSRAFEEKWAAHSSDACGKEHRCTHHTRRDGAPYKKSKIVIKNINIFPRMILPSCACPAPPKK